MLRLYGKISKGAIEMKKFMIGQYGTFDYKKYQRDFKADFYGIEACLFNHQDDTLNLIKESKQGGFRVGVHFPLRAGISTLRDALFLSQDNSTRLHAYNLIQQELDFLDIVKPDYILFHYPKPVILDDRVDWSKWRFADRREFEYESVFTYDEFKEKSDSLFQWLSQKGQEYNFTPVLEFDALNKYIYEGDFLEKLLDKYRDIRLCLDTGRLYMQDRIDPYFEAKSVIKKYAKYAETLHLWNVQITNNNIIENNHYPALPNLNQNDGWAPIEEYLQIINNVNKDVKIMFEHRSDLVSDEELWECYKWVDKILNAD
jgi:hypothetical protein